VTIRIYRRPAAIFRGFFIFGEKKGKDLTQRKRRGDAEGAEKRGGRREGGRKEKSAGERED
jgi:hypothetical protein